MEKITGVCAEGFLDGLERSLGQIGPLWVHGSHCREYCVLDGAISAAYIVCAMTYGLADHLADPEGIVHQLEVRRTGCLEHRLVVWGQGSFLVQALAPELEEMARLAPFPINRFAPWNSSLMSAQSRSSSVIRIPRDMIDTLQASRWALT